MTENALLRAMDQYGDPVYRLAVCRLQNVRAAQDVYMDTFLNLFYLEDSLRPSADQMQSWLLAAANSLCRQLQGQLNQGNPVNLASLMNISGIPEGVQKIWYIAAGLPEKERLCFWMLRGEEAQKQDAERILQISGAAGKARRGEKTILKQQADPSAVALYRRINARIHAPEGLKRTVFFKARNQEKPRGYAEPVKPVKKGSSGKKTVIWAVSLTAAAAVLVLALIFGGSILGSADKSGNPAPQPVTEAAEPSVSQIEQTAPETAVPQTAMAESSPKMVYTSFRKAAPNTPDLQKELGVILDSLALHEREEGLDAVFTYHLTDELVAAVQTEISTIQQENPDYSALDILNHYLVSFSAEESQNQSSLTSTAPIVNNGDGTFSFTLRITKQQAEKLQFQVLGGDGKVLGSYIFQ